MRAFLDAPADPVAIQVLTEHDHGRVADTFDQVLTALTTDRRRLSASPVVVLPAGPLALLRGMTSAGIDHEACIDELLDGLEAAGVGRAVQLHATNGLARLDTTPNAVILRAFPEPGASHVPTAWVDLAGDYLAGDLAGDTPLPLRVLGAEFVSAAASAPGILHQASVAGTWCDAYSGDLASRIRTTSLSFGRAAHLALGIGGPGIDSNGMIARFELLCEAALEFAPLASYVCVDLEPSFAGLAAGMFASWPGEGGAPAHLVAGRFSDRAVPDVFPFQILGPGHRERLGTAYDDLGDLVTELDGGRFSVTTADPSEWLPIHDVHELVQGDHWALLQPLLLTGDEFDTLLGDDVEEPDTPGEPLTSGPALEEIVLEVATHPRRGIRLTLLELVAWLSQGRHSDDPVGVSRVLATFGRLFSQGVDDDERQMLKPYARRLVDSADPASTLRVLGPVDHARAWLACEWTVRTLAVEWLRAAGLTDSADAVARAGPLDDHRVLLELVDLLGRAALIAGRRIDITLDIAGGGPDATADLDAAAWRAWERASEACGWVAASEAASRGVSSDLLYATDLRVMECVREPRIRDELQERKSSVGDQAWSTAMAEVAAEAWREGWKVAADVVYEQSTFSLDTATERTLESIAGRLNLEPDVVESRYIAGEEAARESLAEAALDRSGATERLSAWDDACRAARSIRGGEVWGLTFDGAADAVGSETHLEAMAAARTRVDTLLTDAPDAVRRTVAVAVAREAASAAGRSIALRAAAIAQAHGADLDEIEAAATAALEPTVVALGASAFDLLSAMIDVGSV